MKKILSVIISILMLFTALPFAAAADSTGELVPKSISAVAGKPLLEGVEGHIENLGEENECFVYELPYAEPIITVEFENGEIKKYKHGSDYLFDCQNESGIMFKAGNVYQAEDGKYRAEIAIDGTLLSCFIELEVIANPVESISVNMNVGNTIFENTCGSPETDDAGNSYYNYNTWDILSALNPEITVSYKDKEREPDAFLYNDRFDFEQKSGWNITEKDIPLQTADNPWTAGNDYSFRLDYMGADCEVWFYIRELPVKAISAKATRKILEGNTVKYTDENGIEYEAYDITVATPTVTLYKDSTDYMNYTYWAMEQAFSREYKGVSYSFDSEQGPDNVWGIGTHTAVFHFGELSCEFQVEIVENPIASISARAEMSPIAGDTTEMINEATGEEYQAYEIYSFLPTMIITLKNGETEEYSYGDYWLAEEKYGLEWYFETDQSPNYIWGRGIHTATLHFGSFKCTFEVEIAENPIEYISARATRKLIENIDCGEAYDGEKTYLRYNTYRSYPEITVKLKNSAKPIVCKWEEAYKKLSGFGITSWEIRDDQSPENQWGVGEKHTVTLIMAGISADFEIETVENPIDKFEVKPNGAIYLEKSGMYDIYSTDYTVTVTYKDGSVKEYSSSSIKDETGYDLEIRNETRWTEAGTYRLNASFMNKETSFEVELKDVPYSEIKLRESENHELIITLVEDGISTDYCIMGLIKNSVNKYGLSADVVTDKQILRHVFFMWQTNETDRPSGVSACKGLQIRYLGIMSNAIENGSSWFEMYNSLDLLGETYFSAVNEGSAFRGKVTPDRIDAMLSVAINLEIDFQFGMNYQDKIKFDKYDRYYIASVSEAEQLLEKYFGETDIDVTYSEHYVNDTVEIKVIDTFAVEFAMLVYNPDTAEWVFKNADGIITKKAESTEDSGIKAGFYGDADLSGGIDILDLIKVKKTAARNEYDLFCDYDGDGYVGASDVAGLKQLLFSVYSSVKGDINGDGAVNSEDESWLMKLIIEGTEAYYAPYADINGDGKIDKADCKELRKILSRM